MKKKDQTPFSTTLNSNIKKLLERFCKARGLKINHVVETALISFLEDEMDKEIIEQRSDEETVEWQKQG